VILKRLDDFCEFSRLQVKTGDIDPAYPLIKRFFDLENAQPEQRLWFLFLYTGFYSLGSAWEFWSKGRDPYRVKTTFGFKTGVERRGFRGNERARDYLHEVWAISRRSSLGELLQSGWLDGDTEFTLWRKVRRNYEKLTHCGPWASFKMADLCRNTLDWPIACPDIGEASGPRKGLTFIDTKGSWRRLWDIATERGVPFRGIDQLETALCDFGSMSEGRYYVGHDIDLQRDDVKGTPFLDIRKDVFDPELLVEKASDERRRLNRIYRETGVVWSPYA
jgi:hypothetical protein